MQRAYVRDLDAWAAKGWRPRLDAEGRVRVVPGATGANCYVERAEQPALPGLAGPSNWPDWID